MKKILAVLFSLALIPLVFAYPWGTNRYDLLANTLTFADGTVQTTAGGGGGSCPGGSTDQVQINNGSSACTGITNTVAGYVLTATGVSSAPTFQPASGGGGAGAPPAVISVNATDTTGALTLSGPQTVDGQPLIAGNTVLLTAQGVASQNGVWTINAGAWTRPTAPNVWATGTVIPAQSSVQVGVNLGSVNQGSYWTLDTTSAVTVDTSAQAWSQNFCNSGLATTCATADPQFHPNGSHLANPTVTGTGCSDASPGVSGDNSGAITTAGADTCTLTFGNGMSYGGTNRAPFCAVAGYSATVLPYVSTAPTANAVVFHTAAAGTFSYVCLN